MNVRKHIGILCLSVFLFVISCSENDVQPTNEVLIDSELFLSRDVNDLKSFIAASNLNLDVALLEYSVDIYKINYKTTYLDDVITASGLVILPKTEDPVPMVSFQHGTITADSEAPTKQALSSTELILYAGIAAPGFIGVIPDFIGFGSSAEVFHPYYVESLTASSIVDNLKAAKELAMEKGLSFNGNLFLAGYSQGGYATMATHKYIETEGLPDFNLVASFPAAGGYDVKAMQEYFFGLDTYDNPYYIAYVAMAYKTTFGWSDPLTDFFKEPYASRIPDLFNGSNSSGTINSQLTNNISDLLTDDAIANFETGTKYENLRNAFLDNSLVNWTPKVKIFMYHGDADITVPFDNSVITYNKLIDNGASTDILKFFVIEGGTHSTGVIPYIEDFIPKMLDLK
ncbi:MAG: lipase family protein [Cyclobacteriaceae bacterium]